MCDCRLAHDLQLLHHHPLVLRLTTMISSCNLRGSAQTIDPRAVNECSLSLSQLDSGSPRRRLHACGIVRNHMRMSVSTQFLHACWEIFIQLFATLNANSVMRSKSGVHVSHTNPWLIKRSDCPQMHHQIRLRKLISAAYADIEASVPQYIDAREDEQRLQTFMEWAVGNGS